MKKCEIPKPKFEVGEVVIYQRVSEGNEPAKKAVGVVESINIYLSCAEKSVSYFFQDSDPNEQYGESAIIRRVNL